MLPLLTDFPAEELELAAAGAADWGGTPEGLYPGELATGAAGLGVGFTFFGALLLLGLGASTDAAGRFDGGAGGLPPPPDP